MVDARRTVTLLRRLDALLARATRAREEMKSAKAASDERQRVLTGTRGMWRRNLNAWLRRGGEGRSDC
jgi:hypothetical protein